VIRSPSSGAGAIIRPGAQRIGVRGEYRAGASRIGGYDGLLGRGGTVYVPPLTSQTSVFAAFSLRQLAPQYAGPLVRLQAADTIQQDFSAGSDGFVSASAIAAFVAAHGAVKVAKWYDQSGHGRDVAQATVANQPTFIANRFAKRPSLQFNGAAGNGLTNASVAWTANDLQLFAVLFYSEGAGANWRGLFSLGVSPEYIGTYINTGSSGTDWTAGDGLAFGNQSTTGVPPRSAVTAPNFGINGYVSQHDLTLSAASVDWVQDGTTKALRTAGTSQVPAHTGIMSISPASAFLGAVSEVIVFNSVYAQRTQLRANQKAAWVSLGVNAIDCWGDSLTAGGQDGTATTYPSVIASKFLPEVRHVANDGVGGQTSSQIITRFQAKTSAWPLGNIFWTGTNGGDGPATILSNVATMTSDVAGANGNYFVLSPLTPVTSPSGSSAYNDVITVSNGFASAYGSKYIDIRSMLVAAYNPANPVDVLNHAADVTPFTMRAKLSGTITPAILATDQSFTTSFVTVLAGSVLQVGTEYINVLTATGNQVVTCTRGYAGTTAASYAAGQAATMTDWLHLGANGYTFVANAIYAQMQAQGW
jgi:lysophospholipase L1-like esterase